jgi:ribonuclease HII
MARASSSVKAPIPAKLFCLENQLGQFQLIAGVDEVGRGPLVGAVIAAAVILPDDHGIEGLMDSKRISEKKRESMVDVIKDKAVAWALGRAEAHEIDEINILQASLLAMKRAVTELSTEPQFALVDGNKLPALSCSCHAVVKGDSRVQEISAASIIAKVARDKEMEQLDAYYPHYGFASHKGYPTALHMEMLEKHGATPEHRKSFGPVKRVLGL